MIKKREPLDRFGRPLGKCSNPLCDRKIPQGILYCCAACGLADERKYEIHEDGPLGHSNSCNERHKERTGGQT